MRTSFWQDRRVLITGHTGFKGAWLALLLSRMGAQVTGISDAVPTSPSLYELADIGTDLVADERLDIRDAMLTARAIDRHRPEVVFHLAAQSIVRVSHVNPVETIATNVMGTAHVLDGIRCASEPPRVAVVVTSDKCYENREWRWGYRESEPMGGADPYSASKGAAELVVSAYRRSLLNGPLDTRLASARAGNVFGGGDWGADRLLPDIARAVAAGRSVQVRNPDAVRPWQHVLNPLAGYKLLAERLWEDPATARGWNFGPPDQDVRSVSWVTTHLAATWGRQFEWQHDRQPQPTEATLLKVDSSDARSLLGWAPAWDLKEGLRRTAGWYRDVEAVPTDARRLTLQQIDAYVSDAEQLKGTR